MDVHVTKGEVGYVTKTENSENDQKWFARVSVFRSLFEFIMRWKNIFHFDLFFNNVDSHNNRLSIKCKDTVVATTPTNPGGNTTIQNDDGRIWNFL